MRQDRSLTRWVIAGASVAIVLAAMGLSALAIEVQRTPVTIDGGEADFGNGFHAFGVPQVPGVVTFDYSTVGGVLVARAHITGTLYWDASGAGCAGLLATFKNINGNVIATQTVGGTETSCGSPGGDANRAANQTAVDLIFASANLHAVTLDIGRLIGDPFFILSPSGTHTVSAPRLRDVAVLINNGETDFGSGLHAAGSPVGSGRVRFTRDSGLMACTVSGTLYWDALVGSGRARLSIDFRTSTGTTLATRTITLDGDGGNANDTDNHVAINETFQSGSLWQVRLRVGEVVSGSFVDVATRTVDFTSTGSFVLTPSDPTVAVHEPLQYVLTWTVPQTDPDSQPLTWHDVQAVHLRILDDHGVILWVRFNEADNSFSLFDDARGQFGKAWAAGSPIVLQTPQATLDLAQTSVVGSGPTGPSVTLHLALRFKPLAAERPLYVEVAATDDLGHADDFTQAGTLTVTPSH